jgi:hypothetical protein
MTAPHNAAGVIRQGEDCWIEASNILSPRTGELIDVTGWRVHAVARAWWSRVQLGQRIWQYRITSPVMSEWATNPTGGQGTIVAGIGTDNTDPHRIRLHITAAQTYHWRSPLVLIQAKMFNPITDEPARIIDEVFEIAFDAVPDSSVF